ncbi:unnamed protein product [Arctogadus glacialis]
MEAKPKIETKAIRRVSRSLDQEKNKTHFGINSLTDSNNKEWPLLTLAGLKRTFHVASVWMCSTIQLPPHVDTTSAEPVLQSSGMNKSGEMIRGAEFVPELEQEIEDLTNRRSEVKQLSHTEDHLHFLQAFRSLKDPPPTRDWTTVEVRPPSYVGTLRRSLDQLEETLNMEMEKLPDAELKRVQQYEVDVTLDPDTASSQLILSEDGKQVHDGGVVKTLPDNPKRFTNYIHVLARQSFSSGRFYFEVQVKDKTAWYLGVVRESIDRIGRTEGTPETGYWTLLLNKDGLFFRDDPHVRLPLRAELQKVGVFVDYDEGLVSFYDVEARVHIYSATGCTFSEPLYPLFCPDRHDHEGNNSAPLIISPVNQTD